MTLTMFRNLMHLVILLKKQKATKHRIMVKNKIVRKKI